ncbi:MAG TPA: lycopene cyclase domain-containing protein [Microbacteriaceae bacterium]|nr:lycopene cyclase domain-containing protein [Microbacteriaceae bacterium]
MTYLLLNTVMLAAVAALALVLRARTAPSERVSGRTLAATLGALLLLTAVFDNVIIAAGIVGYDHVHTIGIRIGVAPIEDFAYSVAAAVLIPHMWAWLAGRAAQS